MRAFALAIVTVVFWLITSSGCGEEDDTWEDFNSQIDSFWASSYSGTYSLTSKTASGEQDGNGSLFWTKLGTEAQRFDIDMGTGEPFGKITMISTEGNFIFCPDPAFADRSNSCVEGERAAGPSVAMAELLMLPFMTTLPASPTENDVSDDEAFRRVAQNLETFDDRIAGLEAKCYQYDTPGREYTRTVICYGPNGELLSTRASDGAKEHSFVATEVSSQVDGAVFQPPFTPTSQ